MDVRAAAETGREGFLRVLCIAHDRAIDAGVRGLGVSMRKAELKVISERHMFTTQSLQYHYDTVRVVERRHAAHTLERVDAYYER